jgi:hypothetical protein
MMIVIPVGMVMRGKAFANILIVKGMAVPSATVTRTAANPVILRSVMVEIAEKTTRYSRSQSFNRMC